MTHARGNCAGIQGDRINAVDTRGNILGWYICIRSAIRGIDDGQWEFWKRRTDTTTEAGIRGLREVEA